MSIRFHTWQRDGAQDATVKGLDNILSDRVESTTSKAESFSSETEMRQTLTRCSWMSACLCIRPERKKKTKTRQAGPKDPGFLSGQGCTCERRTPLKKGNATSKIRHTCPGWWGSVDWAPACELKGCWFDPWSEHTPGCGPGPQVGACKRQPMDVSLSHRCFSPFLPPFFSKSK